MIARTKEYKMSGPRLKQPVKLTIIFTLVCLLTVPFLTTNQVTAQIPQSDQYYNKTFQWDYNGNHWTWNLSIPKALYDAYKAVPDSTRTRYGPGGYGFLTTTDDYYIRILVQKLNETTTGLKYSAYDQVSFVLAFVQSLQYTSDNVTAGYNEYPRFPIETLVDEGGDCEDTSILFAAITILLGYGTVYISPPNHYAVGVLGNNLKGTYWTYPADSNRTYYYCETTGSGFKIGQLPDEFQGQSATIYTIDPNRQFVPNIIVDPYVDTTPTPTDPAYVIKTSPTPTVQATPTNGALPTVTGPTQQTVQPLSFNLIAEAPVLFGGVIAGIVGSISLAVWSVRRKKEIPLPPPASIEETLPEPDNTELDVDKFCIFCGSPNKEVAAYCEKCGKQIG